MNYFLVYNDNTHNEYLEPLINSVREHGKQFEIIVFNKEDMDPEFVLKNKAILDEPRGGGYWLWKPYIIDKLMDKIKDGDIIFYIDSKYYFTEDFTGLYKEYMENNDIMVWKNKPNERIWYMQHWCKMHVIMKYDIYHKVFYENAEDCWGGAIIVRKTDKTAQYIKDWLEMCCVYEDITDSPSSIPNHEIYCEHRHDQSMLSIILHQNNIQLQYFEKKYLYNCRTPY